MSPTRAQTLHALRISVLVSALHAGRLSTVAAERLARGDSPNPERHRSSVPASVLPQGLDHLRPGDRASRRRTQRRLCARTKILASLAHRRFRYERVTGKESSRVKGRAPCRWLRDIARSAHASMHRCIHRHVGRTLPQHTRAVNRPWH